MDNLKIPDLLKLCQSKDFQSFAHEVYSGNNEYLKTQVNHHLLKLVGLYKDSKVSNKRPFENETIGKQVEKKIKIDSTKSANLPPEIWLKIMNYLKTKDLFLNFGLISKFFNGLTLDSRAVKYLAVKNIDDITKYNQVSKVIKRSKFLIEITIELSKNYWKHLVCQASEDSKLKIVKILNQNAIGLEHSKKMAKFGKHIEKLEIIDHDIRLDSDALHEISKIKTLKSVKMRFLTDEGMVLLAQNCKELEDLVINRVWGTRNPGMIEAFDTLFAERKHSLKKFHVTDTYALSMHWFRNIHLCQNLEELAIKVRYLKRNDCESISQLRGLKELLILVDEDSKSNLEIIIKSIDVTSLKNLILIDNADRDRKLFQAISKRHFPALERLYIKSSGYSDLEVGELVSNCPKLKSAQLYISPHNFRFRTYCSRSISIHTLINSSIKNNLYIDFGTKEHYNDYYRGSDMLELASMGTRLKEHDHELWLKYQFLKRTFEEWCNENQWSLTNEDENLNVQF